VINFTSVGLAAVTSLDWRTQQVQDLQFANQLERIAPRIWKRRGEDLEGEGDVDLHEVEWV